VIFKAAKAAVQLPPVTAAYGPFLPYAYGWSPSVASHPLLLASRRPSANLRALSNDRLAGTSKDSSAKTATMHDKPTILMVADQKEIPTA
jgi:hypothetical protein